MAETEKGPEKPVEGGEKPEHEPRFYFDKEKIIELPVGAFRGKIHIIRPDSPHDSISHAVRVLRSNRILGFDTETRPSFKKGESHPIALVQISTRNHAFLFRVLEGLPPGLKGILESPKILKIGQGLKHEMRMLRKELGVQGRGFIDMLDIAHKLDCVPKSVKGLSAIFLGFRIIKSAQKTNWARSELTYKQRLYAATDAWACLMLYEEMQRRGLLDKRWKLSHK